MAIYNNSGGKPSTVLLDAGNISTTTASASYEITINQTLTAGLYWLAINTSTAPTTNSFLGSATNNANINGFNLYSDTSGSNVQSGWTENVTLGGGAFATAGTLSTMGTFPFLYLRGA
jgi:hypothetical protein